MKEVSYAIVGSVIALILVFAYGVDRITNAIRESKAESPLEAHLEHFLKDCAQEAGRAHKEVWDLTQTLYNQGVLKNTNGWYCCGVWYGDNQKQK